MDVKVGDTIVIVATNEMSAITPDISIAVVLADSRRAPAVSAIAGSVPQLRSVIVVGPHWGHEGGEGAGAQPPGLAVLPWEAVLAEPGEPVAGDPAMPTRCSSRSSRALSAGSSAATDRLIAAHFRCPVWSSDTPIW